MMDIKDAQKVEIDALKGRNNNLKIMASERNCDILGAATASSDQLVSPEKK